MANETDNSTLDLDTYHEILSNPRRRALIKLLNEHELLDKGELATMIAAEEVGKDPDDVTSDERKRVVISLGQQHLEKLEDASIISTGDGGSIVRQGENFREIATGIDPRANSHEMRMTIKNANVTIEGATVHIDGEVED